MCLGCHLFLALREASKKAGVAPFRNCRGHCVPLWAVFPPLQVVLSSACSVASLSRCPSRYLPGHPHLHEDALADYLFGRGSPSAWHAGYAVVLDTPSAKPPTGAQRGVTLPRWQLHRELALVLLRSCAQRAETAAWLAHWLREFVETRGQTRECCCLVRTESEELRTHRGAQTHDHKVKGLALCRLS